MVAKFAPEKLAEKILGRYERAIPDRLIRRLSTVAAAEAMARYVGVPGTRIHAKFDPLYGMATARHVRRTKSDIFAYSPYAWPAFRANYSHTPKKILFQFHPHFALEDAILAEDLRSSVRFGVDLSGNLEGAENEAHGARMDGDSAWRLADHVVCASTFTKRSLIAAGADPRLITVIPYGVGDLPSNSVPAEPSKEGFHVLFVGSGVQRKGLHYLLLAWRRAKLPPGARLTVVSRVMDPSILKLFRGSSGIALRSGVSNSELAQLYNSASLFAMPSLVEGFGQVYLEALSSGLPVLGTENTCLPDLGNEDDGVFVTTPGCCDELVSKLEFLSTYLQGNLVIKQRARDCAARFTWHDFRQAIKRAASLPASR